MLDANLQQIIKCNASDVKGDIVNRSAI